ncbi:TPA: hypothetical protein N0F65_002675 [Lagenidium giganteum]|uniref:Uncharacterized protein n=1 Tax=Lagenidium giganteum TaxID=4803 RepID=A0AAV2Z5I8_9STRA|nr:TPA: hypothetical protein N0F65_002675 [Lagenidium giganteum]
MCSGVRSIARGTCASSTQRSTSSASPEVTS